MSDPKNPTPFWHSLAPWAKVLFALACIALLIPVLYYGGILLMLLFFILPLSMAPGLLALALALVLGAVALVCKGKWRQTLMRGAVGVALVSAAALAGAYGWDAYQKSITIVDNTNINTSLYLPFDEDSQIARLEGEASLRFSPLDDLPVVDGAGGRPVPGVLGHGQRHLSPEYPGPESGGQPLYLS